MTQCGLTAQGTGAARHLGMSRTSLSAPASYTIYNVLF
jgi:ribosomal protein S14